MYGSHRGRRKSRPVDGGRHRPASCLSVGDMDRLPGADDATQGRFGGLRYRSACACSVKAGGPMCVAQRAEGIFFAQPQSAELGLAKLVAFSSMAWNTGSSSPGELQMTLQHLRGRGLLLQRLGSFFSRSLARALSFLSALPRCTRRSNARSRLRSARTKLATLRSALRALARQGHPRRPVDRQASWPPTSKT